jgi:hypothetical protein
MKNNFNNVTFYFDNYNIEILRNLDYEPNVVVYFDDI